MALRATARRGAWLGPVAVLLLLVPFVARQDVWHEWSNYLWLIEEQAASIRELGHPSLFLHEQFGDFYPQYVFYGGSLWALSGGLSIVIGSAWTAYLLVLAGAVAMGYGGLWWLARQLGAGPWGAHATALVAMASPYLLVGNLYARGDWAEIVALCALPLGLAGALALLRAARVTAGPLAAVIAAAALVAGSHSISIVYGGLFSLALLGALLWATPAAIAWSRLGVVAGAALLGVALDAWFLLPGLSLAHRTQAYADTATLGLRGYDRPGIIFSLWPRRPAPGEPLDAQLPVLALAWALAAGVVLVLRGTDRVLRRVWTVLAGVVAVLIVLILWHGIWAHLPHFLRAIQFAFRLQAYVDLAVAGLVLAGVLAVRRAAAPRGWGIALGVVLAAQLAFAGYVAVASDPERHVGHSEVHAGRVPPSFSEGQQTMFRVSGGRELPRPGPVLGISADDARDEDVDFPTPAGGAGRRYATNVFWSPLIEARGDARIAGRDAEGFVVLEVVHGGAPATIRASAGHGVRAGAIITLLAAFGAVAVLLWVTFRARAAGRRGRRRRRPSRRTAGCASGGRRRAGG